MYQKIIYIVYVALFFNVELAFSGSVECETHGKDIGEMAAKAFCNLLEAEYQGTRQTSHRYRTPPTFCSKKIAFACRKAAITWVYRNRTLCFKLLRSNWNDAKETFKDVSEAACPFP